jgi:hypothetical protein
MVSAASLEAAHLLEVYPQLDLDLVSAQGVFLHASDGRKILASTAGMPSPRSATLTRASFRPSRARPRP